MFFNAQSNPQHCLEPNAYNKDLLQTSLVHDTLGMHRSLQSVHLFFAGSDPAKHDSITKL